jgi:branched-chain amino acid transport system substrate-binding protein
MAGRVDPARHRSSHEWTQFPLPTRCGAQKEINSAGGIGGRKIAITSGDSQGTPVEGVSATRRLIDLDKVDFIIGDVSSSVTLAMQPVVEDAGVLLLNAASSNPKITYAAGVGGFK